MPAALRIAGILLFPLVLLYTAAVWLRNRLYDCSWLKTCRPDAPVISVGNIQIGGTGKTPLTEWLAGWLQKNGRRPAILTRGYRRSDSSLTLVDERNRNRVTPEQIGDEPFLLKENLPGVVLGVSADRCRAAALIQSRLPEAVFVLDDGFQHRRLQRDLDIVLIDVSRWSAMPLLFPLSDFRDVKSSLQRAGVFILTHWREAEEKSARLRRTLERKYRVPVLKADLLPQKLVSFSGDRSLELPALRGRPVAAFCGLANPRQFYQMLLAQGADIVWQKSFADHHPYSREDLRELGQHAREKGAVLIITTQKDAVKAARWVPETDKQFLYLKIGLRITEERLLTDLLEKTLEVRPRGEAAG